VMLALWTWRLRRPEKHGPAPAAVASERPQQA